MEHKLKILPQYFKAVEELENIYSRDTELTIEIRKQLNGSEEE